MNMTIGADQNMFSVSPKGVKMWYDYSTLISLFTFFEPTKA